MQVSSSTIFVSKPELLPQLDLQVIPAYLPKNPDELTAEAVKHAIAEGFERLDIASHEIGRQVAIALIGPVIPTYQSIKAVCAALAESLQPLSDWPWTIILSADVAGLI